MQISKFKNYYYHMFHNFFYDICNVLWSCSYHRWYRIRYFCQQLSCKSFRTSYLRTLIFFDRKNTKKKSRNHIIRCGRDVCSSLNICSKTRRLWLVYSKHHWNHCRFHFQSLCFFLFLLLSSIFLRVIPSKSPWNGSRNRFSSWDPCLDFKPYLSRVSEKKWNQCYEFLRIICDHCYWKFDSPWRNKRKSP